MKTFQKILILKMPIGMIINRLLLCSSLLSILSFTMAQAQTVTDIDGNVYNTVTIGTQVWMKENLKTTKYNDGTAIPNILTTSQREWLENITGAYCDYEDNSANSDIYGRLYNGYAIAKTNINQICPINWHMPTLDEWTTLTIYLGGKNIAGGKLKETGTLHWGSPNQGATNETGFTALPGGSRSGFGGGYPTNGIGLGGFWWYETTEKDFAGKASMSYLGTSVDLTVYQRSYGYSVRCIKDISTDVINNSTPIFEVYPNPVNGILFVSYRGENYETIYVFNSQGSIIKKVKALSNEQQIDFSKYKPGLYLLEFIKSSGEVTRAKVLRN